MSHYFTLPESFFPLCRTSSCYLLILQKQKSFPGRGGGKFQPRTSPGRRSSILLPILTIPRHCLRKLVSDNSQIISQTTGRVHHKQSNLPQWASAQTVPVHWLLLAAAFPLMAINTPPTSLGSQARDAGLFPLLIAHCLGSGWGPGRKSCQARCFFRARRPQGNDYFLEAWGAGPHSAQSAGPVVVDTHFYQREWNERIFPSVCVSQVRGAFLLSICPWWEDKKERKALTRESLLPVMTGHLFLSEFWSESFPYLN